MRLNRTCLLLLPILGLLGAAGAAETPPATKLARPVPEIERALLISVDGCRPDVMLRANTPNIHKLIEAGSYTMWARTIPVAITLPDVNQALKKMKGRVLPFGWWHFLNRNRISDQVRVGFLGVKPEHQHTGVAASLYVEHFDTASRTPQKWGEMGWILESNRNMNKAMDDASWAMIELLQKDRGLSRLDAYSLASMTMDCRVGEMDAAEKGVHCLVAKSMWKK